MVRVRLCPIWPLMSPLTPADRAMALARPGASEDDVERYEELVALRIEDREAAPAEQADELRALAVKLGFTRC